MIYWQTSHETGDITDWTKDQGGNAVFNTGEAEVTVSTEYARTGLYALKKEVWGIDAGSVATRIFRWAENLEEGYFGAWFMFPVLPQVDGWLLLVQFKTGEPTWEPCWYNNVMSTPDGPILALIQWYGWEGAAGDVPPNVGESPILEAGKWFHIEWYYKRDAIDGAIKIWIDGKLIWDLSGINTLMHETIEGIHWAPSLYGEYVNPGNLVMYVDDCVISSERIGIGGEVAILKDGESYTFENLEPGTYLVSGLVPEGWELAQDNFQIVLAEGDQITVVFLYSELIGVGSIIVTVETTPGGATQEFEITLVKI